MNWDGKYGIKVSWIVIRFGKYGRKISWLVKRYGKYGRKVTLVVMKNMENTEEKCNLFKFTLCPTVRGITLHLKG